MNTPAIKEQKTVPSVSATGLFNLNHRQMISFAAEVATELANIIETQKLYNLIQGKKYVRVEGWNTMGAMLGIVPREVSADEQKDGSYIGEVELYQVANDKVVGRASALCGVDEKRWKSADKYARRSMAVTRATGKAFRLGFSWIMAMAGYEVTPFEEMPFEVEQSVVEGEIVSSSETKTRPVSEQAKDLKSQHKAQAKPVKSPIYTGSQEDVDGLIEIIESAGFADTMALMDQIDKLFLNKPKTEIIAFINDLKKNKQAYKQA